MTVDGSPGDTAVEPVPGERGDLRRQDRDVERLLPSL